MESSEILEHVHSTDNIGCSRSVSSISVVRLTFSFDGDQTPKLVRGRHWTCYIRRDVAWRSHQQKELLVLR